MIRAFVVSACLVAASLGGARAGGAPPECDGALCAQTRVVDGKARLVARNVDEAMTITVVLDLGAPKSDGERLRFAVLAPGERVRMAALPRSEAEGLAPLYRWIPGNAFARPDLSVTYRLPFEGRRQVAQGCGGWFSHRGATANAVDFDMPEGTPVLALRAGRVVILRMSGTEGGLSRAHLGTENRIAVEHDDGTMTLYAHLAANSQRVERGERVAAGDVLALSGNTGLSSAPHLHVELFTPTEDGDRRTWPIPFETDAGIVTCPRIGEMLGG